MEVTMHYSTKNLRHYVAVSSANATVSTCKCESTKTVGDWLIVLCMLSDILEIWKSLDFHQGWNLPQVSIICTNMYVFGHNLHYYVSKYIKQYAKNAEKIKYIRRDSVMRLLLLLLFFCFQPSCQSFVSAGECKKLFEVRTSGIFWRDFPLAVACRASCLAALIFA